YEGVAEVINGVDFTIERGETIGLVGETGCGKSVTAKALLGLLPEVADIPEGEILFKGQNVLEMSNKERHRLRGQEMSMIMQDPMTSLNPVFTIGEQMMDVLKWQDKENIGVYSVIKDALGSSRKQEYREKALNILEEVQISDPERVLSSYPIELSGGMRQRILIAMALLSEPEFLIADEPGTALDVTTEAKILELLNKLIGEKGASVMYITHDLGVAKKVTDRINVMYAGNIVEQGPVEPLFRDPCHPYTRGLLDSIPQLAHGIGEGIEGQLPDYTSASNACRFAERCPYATSECEQTFPYLRETSDGHSVACHLFDGNPVYDRHQDLAAERIDIGKAPWQEGDSEEHATHLKGGSE
ncbi:MAG: ABC transporter ATP-binding protein, partial [Halobacteriaceae archaeon]